MNSRQALVSWVSASPLEATRCILDTLLVAYDHCDFGSGRVLLNVSEIAARVGRSEAQVDWCLDYLGRVGFLDAVSGCFDGVSEVLMELTLDIPALGAVFDLRRLTAAMHGGVPACRSRAYLQVCNSFSDYLASGKRLLS